MLAVAAASDRQERSSVSSPGVSPTTRRSLASIGHRDLVFRLLHARGDELHHGDAGVDRPVRPQCRLKARDVFV